MQDFFRQQKNEQMDTNFSKNYNLVNLIFSGIYTIRNRANCSLSFYFFDECLSTIIELIQGPNILNQKNAI